MTQQYKPVSDYRIPTAAVLAFAIITFSITWGVVGMYIMLPDWASETFGTISGAHPLFFLATWAPAIAAISIVAFFSGLAGLKAFFGRLLLWQCPSGWVAFIAIVIPLTFVAGSLLKSGPLLAPIPEEGITGLVVVLFLMLFLGPIEEFGWRGLAQPILQRHVAPFWAGAIIGAVWGVWHLPAFFLTTTVFAGWNFFPFLVGNITLAILVTPLFNETRGSLLWPMLFHWQLINPFWADAQPYDTWILVAVAAVVVIWNRDTMFTRKKSTKWVVPNGAPNRALDGG